MDDLEKKYFRFLKEHGVYQRSIEIHKKAMHSKALTFHALLSSNKPISWIQDATIFCQWASSPEGDAFWWVISLLWQSECIINGYSYFDYGRITTALDIKKNIDEYVNYYNLGTGSIERSIIDKDKIGELKNKLLENKKKLELIIEKTSLI